MSNVRSAPAAVPASRHSLAPASTARRIPASVRNWRRAASRSSVAFCPRSHAFFKHRDHPWRRLLAAGVNVCLGTDSLASSPSLSVLDEARFLFAQGDADPQTLLAMATRRGARALGLEDVTGDLREGLAAEFCVIEPAAASREPLAAIMAGQAGPVRLVRP